MRAKIDPKKDQAVRRFLAGIAHDYEMAVRCCMAAVHAAPTALTSDADVAILLKGERRKLLPTSLAMPDVAYDVLLETGINISPLPVWLEEWEHPETYCNPALLHAIAREGVVL